MKHLFRIGILYFVFTAPTCSQNSIDHLKTFAKAYGYVKYFHPSTEASKIDWDTFSAYGSSKVLECKNNRELVMTLNSLFKPIGPSISFTSKQKEFDLNTITPNNLDDYKETYWQHRGVSIGMQYNLYESSLINQPKVIDDTLVVIAEPIFDKKPEVGELIEEKIGSRVYCYIPLSLYCDEGNTFPIGKNFESLNSLVKRFDAELTKASVRIGNIINVYNTMQHFYPYFDVVDIDWDYELEVALKRSLEDENEEDHLITVQKFMAKLQDSHTWVWQGASPYAFYPPISWQWIQDSLMITKVSSDTLNIKVGDVVTHINNQSSEEYFEEVNSRISHGTKTYLNHSIQTRSLSAAEGTELILQVNGEEILLKHDNPKSVKNTPPFQKHLYKLIGHDLMYVNLASIPSDTLSKILPRLKQMKGLVCDYRGRNLAVWDFPYHFSKDSIESGFTINDPQIIYPNQEQITFDHIQGINEPKDPYLGDIKTVFIVDGSVKSAGESFISTVKHNNLAIIVGEQTAGADGYINPFKVLGDITIWWTGTKCLHADGRQFHCVGIQPDVFVEKTIQGIREGKDEFLEKAIEIIKQ